MHDSRLSLQNQDVSTFGFRGEALSSLCALATVSITTRTVNTNPAQRLTYDHTGALVATTPTARAVGTTVAVKDLFKTLPVRHKVQKGAMDYCTWPRVLPQQLTVNCQKLCMYVCHSKPVTMLSYDMCVLQHYTTQHVLADHVCYACTPLLHTCEC